MGFKGVFIAWICYTDDLKMAAVKFCDLSDDGKIFVGSGIGDPFGPRCHKGNTENLEIFT